MERGKTVTKSARKSNPPATPAPRSPRGGLRVLTLIFRLLLLTVGGSCAWVLGMLAAQVYPSSVVEVPLTEQLLRQVRGSVPGTKRLSTPSPAPEIPSPTSPTPSPQSSLSPAQRERLQIDLRQLQGELNALIGRTAALETQLGTSRPTESLEKRLDLMSQQLAAPVSVASPTPPLPTVGSRPSPTPEVPSVENPVFSGEALMVTLPSDVLFDANSSALRSGTNVILDNLVADLRNYQGATVRVAGHTDDGGDAKDNQNLSFARAQAVMQYLSETLGDQYHWMVLGYGEGRPSVDNNSETNRQRNRRIEVAITP